MEDAKQIGMMVAGAIVITAAIWSPVLYFYKHYEPYPEKNMACEQPLGAQILKSMSEHPKD